MKRTSRSGAVRDFTAETVLSHDPNLVDRRTHAELRHHRVMTPPLPAEPEPEPAEPEPEPKETKTEEKRKRKRKR